MDVREVLGSGGDVFLAGGVFVSMTGACAQESCEYVRNVLVPEEEDT